MYVAVVRSVTAADHQPQPSHDGHAHRDADGTALSDADSRSRLHPLHEHGAWLQRRSASGMAPRELQPGDRYDLADQSG